MSKSCPQQVWISWCDECGQADYAYNKEPKKSDIGCPTCGTHPDCQLIAGPFVLLGTVPDLRAESEDPGEGILVPIPEQLRDGEHAGCLLCGTLDRKVPCPRGKDHMWFWNVTRGALPALPLIRVSRGAYAARPPGDTCGVAEYDPRETHGDTCMEIVTVERWTAGALAANHGDEQECGRPATHFCLPHHIVMCAEHAYCPDSKPIVSHRPSAAGAGRRGGASPARRK